MPWDQKLPGVDSTVSSPMMGTSSLSSDKRRRKTRSSRHYSETRLLVILSNIRRTTSYKFAKRFTESCRGLSCLARGINYRVWGELPQDVNVKGRNPELVFLAGLHKN